MCRKPVHMKLNQHKVSFVSLFCVSSPLPAAIHPHITIAMTVGLKWLLGGTSLRNMLSFVDTEINTFRWAAASHVCVCVKRAGIKSGQINEVRETVRVCVWGGWDKTVPTFRHFVGFRPNWRPPGPVFPLKVVMYSSYTLRNIWTPTQHGQKLEGSFTHWTLRRSVTSARFSVAPCTCLKGNVCFPMREKWDESLRRRWTFIHHTLIHTL